MGGIPWPDGQTVAHRISWEAIYHVLSREDWREAIFRSDADRKLFLDLLGLTYRRSFTTVLQLRSVNT